MGDYSVQQLIDCCPAPIGGCGLGGSLSDVFQCIINLGGIEPSASYVPENCVIEKNETVNCVITGIQTISGEQALYKQTSSPNGGPVGICVDATSWPAYLGGILTQCPDSTISHCVQLTGYSHYGKKTPFWLVLNNWGQDWGEHGYIYLAVGQDLCGIGDNAEIITVSVTGK